MFKFLSKTKLFVTVFLIATTNIFSQTLIIDPSADGGFEGSHGWTILNTTNINKWVVGSAAKTAGSSGAYISNDNSANTITNPQASNSRIYIYKDVVVPNNANSISISFKYRNAGTDVPAPKCMFALANTFPQLPTDGATYLVGADFATVLNNASNWVTYTNTNPLTLDRPITYASQTLIPGATYRIMFEWGASCQTCKVQTSPICVYPDSGRLSGNFSVTPGTTMSYTALTFGGSNFTYNWSLTGGATISSGQGTNTVNVYFPPNYTTGNILCQLNCPTPIYSNSGTTGGTIGIDEVSIAYIGRPIITSFSPSTSAVGSSVTILGQNFGATASDNMVYLGGMRCNITSASASSITVTVPPHSSVDKYTVINKTLNLNATSQKDFVTINSSLSNINYAPYAKASFDSVQTFTTLTQPSSVNQKLIYADIDGDTKMDILTLSNAGVPQVWRNTSTSGTISSSSLTSSSIASVSPTITTAAVVNAFDYNNDGKIDIAGANGTTTQNGFVNINSSVSGTPNFKNFISLLTSSSKYTVGSALLAIDLNNDGRTDIFGTDNSTGLTYTINNSNIDTFKAITGLSTNTTTSINQFISNTALCGASGDLNNDGMVDIVVGGSNGISVLQNKTTKGSPTIKGFNFKEMDSKIAGAGNMNTVKIADLDGDGKLDVLAGSQSSSSLLVFKNNTSDSANITLADAVNFTTSFSFQISGIALGDMNGDGKLDVVMANNASNQGIGYFENTSTSGTISFGPFLKLFSTGYFHQIDLIDIDGDNKLDIITSGGTTSNQTTISIFRNRQGEAGVIGSNQTICYNTIPAAFTSISAASISSGTAQYQWQSSTVADFSSAVTTISGATAETYTHTSALATTTYFRRRVNSSLSTGNYFYSNPIIVTVTTQPSAPTGIVDSSCGTGTVTLKASVAAGNSIKWYSAASGGTILGTGTSYTTPSISSTTIYYAETATPNNCPSASRTAIIATVITAMPIITASTAATRCDAGPLTISATTNNRGVVRWYSAATGGSLLYTGNVYNMSNLATTTTYYVEGNNCNGSTATRTAVIATVTPTPQILTTTPVSACQNSNATLSAIASSGTLAWFLDSVSASGSSAIVSAITANTRRFVSASITVNSVTCSSPRVGVNATVLALPTKSTNANVNLCGKNTATITTIPPTKGRIEWYSALTGGNLLGTGNSFTTPILNATATYYALAIDSNGCLASARTADTVKYTGPTVSGITNVNAVTNSTNNGFIAQSMANYSSFIWQRSIDSMNWTDITASLDPGMTYSGFTGTSGTIDTLKLSSALSNMHNYYYRIKLSQTTAGCDNYSNTAQLKVADIYGTCLGTAPLLVKGHAQYTNLQTLWYHGCSCDQNNQMTNYCYAYDSYFNSPSSSTLKDGSSISGLAVNKDASNYSFITIDLGASYYINKVYLRGLSEELWDNTMSQCSTVVNRHMNGGDLWISNDLTNWTKIYSGITETNQPYWGTTVEFPAINARYVKATSSMYSNGGLSEFYAYPMDMSSSPFIRYNPPSQQYISNGGTLNIPVQVIASAGTLTYQWSKSTDNITFTNLTNSGKTSGVTTSTLNIDSFNTSNVGWYRLTATQSSGSCYVYTTIRVDNIAPYYSSNAGSSVLQTLSSWNTGTTGTGGSAPTDFGNGKYYILANSGTSSYTLGTNWVNNGTLRLNKNKLTLGNFHANMDTVIEGSSIAFVKTNGTGFLKSPVTTALTPKTFPVGMSNYSPVDIANYTGTLDTFAVMVQDSVRTLGATGTSLKNVVNKTWVISKLLNNATNIVNGVNLTFKWLPSDTIGKVATPALYAYVSGTGWVQQTATFVSRTDSTVSYSGYKGTLNNTMFMLSNPIPTITSISPSSAGSGMTVVINGTGFTNTSLVTFGGTAVQSYTVNSENQITVVLGTGSSGSVSVTTPGGTAVLAGFTYISAPKITYFTPTKTNMGNVVSIYGSNFNNATAVAFGSTAASNYTVISNNQIDAVIKSGSSGFVKVTTPGGVDSMAGFTYGIPYDSLSVLAGWNPVNTSNQSFPYPASFVKTSIVSASANTQNGLTAINEASNKWINTNNNATLDINTAPYLSYTITTNKNVKFDRFVLPGLKSTSSKLQLRWNVDNYTSSLGEFTQNNSGSNSLTSKDLTNTATQASGAITFRIYFYNGNNDTVTMAGGTGNSTIDGTTPLNYDATYAAFIMGANKPIPSLSGFYDIIKNVSDNPFYAGIPSSNSSGVFTFSLGDTTVATITGPRITLKTTGTSSITATQAETADYASASASANIIVKTAPMIFFPNSNKYTSTGVFELYASRNSVGTYTYSSSNTAVASVLGTTATPIANGLTVLTMNQAANGNYTADSVKAVMTVSSLNLYNVNFSLNPVINKTLGDPNFDFRASLLNDGVNILTYSSSNPKVATLNIYTATILNSGFSILTYGTTSSSRNAGSVSTVLVVSDPNKTNPSIGSLPNYRKKITDSAFKLNPPTSNSSGDFYYVSSNPSIAYIKGDSVFITGSGQCHIVAIQNAAGSYNAGAVFDSLFVSPTITYNSQYTYTRGNIIASQIPTLKPAVLTSYRMFQTLPRGLAFNTSSGTLTGMSTVTSPNTKYYVIDSNTGGKDTVSFWMKVVDPAPSSISYTTPNVYTVGTTISSLSPNFSGVVDKFTIAPTLPSGLTIDSITGEISGTPNAAKTMTTFVVTASNTGGSISCNVVITVNDQGIASLQYPTPNILAKGVASDTIIPSVSGGAVTKYAISPSLPAGLILDTFRGYIYGTPLAASPTLVSYVVTATNNAGSLKDTFQILINDERPTNLQYPSPDTFYTCYAITPLTPTYQGGVPTSYSITPSLPLGLTFNTSTGIITGTPTNVDTALKDYEITAINFIGFSTKTIQLRILSGTPKITSNPSVTRCGPGSTTLNATATNGTINWYNNSNSTSSLNAGSSYTSNIGFTTTYYIDATDFCGTSPRVPIAANVIPLAVITGYDTIYIDNYHQLSVNKSKHPNTPWQSSNSSKVSIDNNGRLFGNALGTSIVTFMDSVGCQQTKTIEVIEIQWTGNSNTDFNTGNNWSGRSVPDTIKSMKISALASNDMKLTRHTRIGTLDFNGSNKKVNLYNYDMTIDTIAGYNANNYIMSSGLGKVKKSILINRIFTFPVGRSSYNPISIKNKTGVLDTFSINLDDSVYLNGTSGIAITGPHVKRTWNIGKNSANTGSGIDVTFNWNSGDVVGTLAAPTMNHHSGTNWEIPTSGTATVNANSLTYTGYMGTFSPFAIGGSSTVGLPVELKEFDAICHEDYINVAWTTASEKNNDRFELYKSPDAKTWTKIYTIKGQGTKATDTKYVFNDTEKEEHTSYYKLIDFDMNGHVNESSVIVSDCDFVPATIMVSPNPAKEFIEISIPFEENARYNIIDLNGKIMTSGALLSRKSRVYIEAFASGIYILEIVKPSEKSQIKIIKQ